MGPAPAQSALADDDVRAIPAPALIIGSGGMLGRAWRQLLAGLNIEHHAADVDEIDIARDECIQQVAARPWRTVINCAAWTNVDAAEEHESEAMEINARGVDRLARACRQRGATLVHYSTDYVFDGRADTPYPTDHPRNPINAYGRSKAAGEEALEQSGADFLLIRTSWLYAPWGQNFVRTMVRLCHEKPQLQVVSDQRGRPTSAEHLARATAALLARSARGTCHLTDGGECTWFDFAAEIVRLTSAPCQVTPCTTADFPRPACRPAYSVLDLSSTEAMIGPMPEWRSNLKDVVRRLENA